MSTKPICHPFPRRNGSTMPRFVIRFHHDHMPSGVTTQCHDRPGYRLVAAEIGARHIGGIMLGWLTWLPSVLVFEEQAA